MTDNLFEDPNKPVAPEHVGTPEAKPESYYETLVGEGKKFTDRESLAKGKIESDSFIVRLQEENEGLRHDLANRLTLEEFMKKIDERETPTTPPSNSPQPHENEQGDQNKGISMEEVSSLFEQEFTRRASEQTRKTNVETCIEEAQKAYGPSYKQELTKRATELDINQDDLSAMAATQPKAFLSLMIDPAKRTPDFTPPPSSEMSTENMGGQSAPFSRKSHFDKVRRDDPARYWDPKFQNEMHLTAQREGEAFFDN